ncbi:hypothetical protein Vretifemale_10107 [Volvox reticuliferus]|nr:hypothetical protein Vretifemale_10107 [Volvox reticuliferus]
MERALSRILELLQPAADAAAATAAAPAAATAAGAGGTAATGGDLMALSVSEMAALARKGLSPESRRALEADLGQYVQLAEALRVEMPEMPLPFAAALREKLTADREARERASAALRRSAEAGDVDGGPSVGTPDVQVAVCELEETFSGPIFLTPTRTTQRAPDSSSGGGDRAGPSARPRDGGASEEPGTELAAVATAPPPRLRGRPLQGQSRGRQGASGAGGRIRSRGAADSGGSSSLERNVRKNRPLSEIIAAANASLDSRYERQLAAGFRELCARLTTATAAAATAAAAAAATAKDGPDGQPASAGASATIAAPYGEDVYDLLSLLRRLSLWPVTVERLRVTGAGREVAKLRKHSCPQVAHLARTLIARWKALAANASAANNKPNGKAAGVAAKGRATSPTDPEVAAAAAATAVANRTAIVDEQLREKVRTMLAASLRTHVEAAARAGNRVPEPADLGPERLALTAHDLEAAVFQAHGQDGTSYKSQTRMLVGALKHADGVAVDLLSGTTDPRVMATADSMALAPASVRAQAEEVARKKRLEMEAWEKLAGQGGGASTYKSAATVCPSCGGSGATVHNVLSGGTYAQERVQIQKFVCDHCGSTWRND